MMRKTIITLCAFLTIFSFAVTGVMAQTWTWNPPAQITNGVFFDDFVVIDDVLNGCVEGSCEPLATSGPGTGIETFTNEVFVTPAVEYVDTPPLGVRYGIDPNTVAMWDVSAYVALDVQPTVPDGVTGTFAHIAAASDGTLYVIFENEDTAQYLLIGKPPFLWEIVKVRFTPRSLNLGSKGKWVTCKISDFPKNEDEYQYTPADVDLDNFCIVMINDTLLDQPICSKDSNGPVNNRNKKKLMVKFDRKVLIGQIDSEATSAKITVAGYSLDDTLQFYGEDTIKTKPAKTPKPKKK